MNWSKYTVEGQMSLFDLGDIWFGRMSTEHGAQTAARISESFSKKRPASKIQMPLFLDLRGENGHRADVSWETAIPWLGEDIMRQIGECHSAEKGYVYLLTLTETARDGFYLKLNCGEKPIHPRPSRLSDILETNPDPKYNLSARACQGILNRAERRGKELPKVLKDALIQQASLSKLGGGAEFDRCGKRAGKGALIQEELSGTLGVSQDQTLFCLEGNGSRDSHKGDGYKESATMYTLNTVEQHGVCYGLNRERCGAVIAENIMPTIQAAAGESGNNQPMVCYGLDRASFNQGKNAQYNFSVEEEVAQTLVSKGTGGVLARQWERFAPEIIKG